MCAPSRAWPAVPVLRILLLAGTALLYTVGLSRSGWGNSFYAAAAQAGSQSWTALFFGSSDAGNSITVDKPPAAIWVMGLSARLFGLSSWSVLLPQALMGVATVALVAATVRRVLGPWPGLLAGLLLAVTPVVTLVFRYDNPDALLTLLVVAAAWTTVRAVEDGRLRWALATGALLGLAFLTKSLQALLVMPGLAAALLVAGPGAWRRRIGALALAGTTFVVAAGWWFLVVALIPARGRPWVGGSTADSPLQLAFGYNGLGRLAGERSPSGHPVPVGSWLRLFGSAGDQVAWLLPAAALALVAGVVLLRRAPRTDLVRASLILWGGWAVVTALVLSAMRGIFHSYYTVELAPGVAALVATGATLLWRRRTTGARAVLAVGSVLTTGWAAALVLRSLPPARGAAPVVLVGAVVLLGAAGVALLRPRADRWESPVVRRVAAMALVAAAVLGPAAWSVATAARAHTGSSIAAGPAQAHPRAPAYPAPPASPAALALLREDTDDFTWTAAAVGHRAGDLQLTVGAPVMPVGGFAGHDPSPSLARFQADVAHHRVHWYVPGARGSGSAARIDAWVRTHAPMVRAGRTTLYDLSALGDAQP